MRLNLNNICNLDYGEERRPKKTQMQKGRDIDDDFEWNPLGQCETQTIRIWTILILAI